MNLTVRKRDEKGRYLPNGGTVEKKRKAVVKYRRTADGQNKIIALEGFLSVEEIKEIGTEVWRIWSGQEHRMYAESCILVFMSLVPNALTGSIYTAEEFYSLISEMKACGKALSRIIRAVREAELNEIRVIEI